MDGNPGRQPDEKGGRSARPGQMDLLAFLWGLAEATVFFIVPDVLITLAALGGWRKGLRAALFAVAGALPGGALMFLLGRSHPELMRQLVDAVPAVSPAMIAQVADQIERYGYMAVFLGPLWGAPYKAYAVLAGQAGLSIVPFLLVSLPARLVRFVLLAFVAAGLGQWLRRRFGPRAPLVTWSAAWSLFYAVWFALMPD